MSKPSPEAKLKMYNRMEAWEWVEDGVLKIQLTGKGVLADYELSPVKGQFLEEEHFDIVATEDCDVYLPTEDDLLSMFQSEEPPEERLLMSFRKGVVSPELSDLCWDNLKTCAAAADNRGLAAGPIDTRYIRSNAQKGNLVPMGTNRAKYTLPDGSLGKTTIANKARSGIAGWFDPSPRFRFVRRSSWTKLNLDKLEAAAPFLRRIGELYRELAPLHWARQREFVETFDSTFRLSDTVYTTLTVNRNWQAAVHQDKGDFPRGFGSIAVVERRPYTGGWTGFPRYRVAADIRTGDFFGFNIHKFHGMTAMKPTTPHPDGGEWDHHIDPFGEHGFDRLSVVFYARSGMAKARSPEAEREAYEAWRDGFKTSKEQAGANAEKRQAELEFNERELEELTSLLAGN